MIKLEITIGPEAFEQGQFVYVWLDAKSEPFYVGETAQSLADRAGLHIRDPSRSGAIVGRIIRQRKRQTYSVLAFSLDPRLLDAVARENGASQNSAARNRARKAIERRVFELLSSSFSSLHRARGCSWNASAADSFVRSVFDVCVAQAGNSHPDRLHRSCE
jgi:hypothetical protein